MCFPENMEKKSSLTYAPIILFAFNRLEPLKATVASLLKNDEAKESVLYVFVDGARPKIEGELQKVRQVQEFVKSITGFKRLHYQFSSKNKGLGPSIIAGVTEIINQYGKAIVLEDDLVFTKNFLSFMNQGLVRYEKEDKVFSICGYTNKVNRPSDYSADSYFCVRSSSWGWATWADRWNSVDWELTDWDRCTQYSRAFNNWGGSDCWHMLNDWHKGKNHSWAIRFCFAQFLQDKISLFPMKSLVQNDGFDGEGTNCKKWSRFKCELDKECKAGFGWPSTLQVNKKLSKQAIHYHSLYLRIWSKIMYIIHQ